MPTRVGDLPLDTNLNGDLTVKRGDKLDNPRGGVKQSFQFKVSEGFEVLSAKVKRLADQTAAQIGSSLSEDTKLFFRKSKSAVQSQYVELTSDVFEDYLKYRWSKISQADITRWETESKTVAEGVAFEFFMYIPRWRRQQETTIRRATAGRIQDAASRLRQFERDNNIQLGNIQRNHLQIHFARQPPETEIQIPNDNTTRQAAALDNEMAEIRRQEADNERRSSSNLRTIRIEFNNSLVNIRVDIASLRTALGLPQHDLFFGGLYQQYQHPTLDDEDNIEDVDHHEHEYDEEVPGQRGGVI